MANTKTNTIKIGIAAIVSLVVLFLGVNWLKGLPMFKEGQNYCLACDKVDGLAVSSHVMLHGMKVGTVLQMEYDAKTDLVNVLFSIRDKEMRIPKDTRLTVVPELLGTANIIIEMGESQEFYSPGDTIVAPPSPASLLEKADPIVAQVEQLMPKLDTLIGGINVLVNESRLQESLLEVNTLTKHLNQTVNRAQQADAQDVPEVMDHMKGIAANVDTLSTELKDAQVSEVLTQANKTLAEVNQLLEAMQSQDSSVGQLLTTTQLHDQLLQTVTDVDALVNDIKQNPKKYIHIKVF